MIAVSARALERVTSGACLSMLAVAAVAVVWLGAWPRPIEVVLAALVFLGTLGTDLRVPRVIRALLAVALLALLVASAAWLPHGIDYTTFYRGAELLFRDGRTPYAFAGTVAAPFPTFHLVWLLSGGLALPLDVARRLFWAATVVVLAAAWTLAVIAAHRAPGPKRGHAPLLVAVVFHPAVALGLVLGQTSAWTMAAAVGAFALWQGPTRAHALAAGLLLALGVLLKPGFALVPVAFVLLAVADLLAGRVRSSASSPEVLVGLGVLIAVPACVLLSSVLAPSAMIAAWWEWPALAHGWAFEVTEKFRGDYAPAAVLAKRLVKHLPLAYTPTLSVLTQVFVGAVVALNALVLFRGRARSFDHCVPWVLGTLLVSPLTWAHYLVWALPACAWLLAREDAAPPGRRLLGRLGFALTFVFSSFLFTVGLLLLYLVSLWRAGVPDEREATA